MPRTRIKICGVCRPQDAAVAVKYGADAVGMIRVRGKERYVSIADAKAIAAELPAFVTPVLLYVDTTPDEVISDIVQLGRPVTIQINGDDPVSTLTALRGVSVLRAVRVDATITERLAELRTAELPNLVGIVLETPGQVGGSGVGNDWKTVAQIQADGAFNGLPPLIAAGGLTIGSVGQVIRDIKPYAVDVSSGVDETKREKSEKKIAAFIQEVRKAGASS